VKDEFEYDERCGACRACVDHPLKDHKKQIELYLKRESDRCDALMRQAKRQYERP